MRYIFLDTNLFIDVVTSNDGESILNSILKQLAKKGVVLVLPEVIKMEILTQYTFWKQGVAENIKLNLDTKRILGIKEALTDTEKKDKKKQKGETEAEKIDSLMAPHRAQMIKKIEGYYRAISKKTEQIFRHKNTKMIALSDQILLAGMKRSLLKKSPYTRTDKGTENAHTKDIDCIAFETLAAFCKKSSQGNIKNSLIMCVSDKDYFSTDGNLHSDLKEDIKMETKFYRTIPEMLEKEFKVLIVQKRSKKNKKTEDSIGSLAGSNGGLAESLKTSP